MATKKITPATKPAAPAKQAAPVSAEPRPHGWKAAEARRKGAEAEAQRKAEREASGGK